MIHIMCHAIYQINATVFKLKIAYWLTHSLCSYWLLMEKIDHDTIRDVMLHCVFCFWEINCIVFVCPHKHIFKAKICCFFFGTEYWHVFFWQMIIHIFLVLHVFSCEIIVVIISLLMLKILKIMNLNSDIAYYNVLQT